MQTYRISDHTLVRHVRVGGGPMSVMFRAVDPDIRVSMIKQEMFKFWEGTIYVQDLNATGAPTCTIILCIQKQHMPPRLSLPLRMIPDLPGWDATERRPFGGIGPFIYIGHKT